ncbi:MAG TPA: tyrosine-protein phosphatase [Gemmataceae bacterium]|jgi:protein tyrosine/serine phosphatase|nr:tyrosine-protein phosphatase [Gemmataceae bacterium]
MPTGIGALLAKSRAWRWPFLLGCAAGLSLLLAVYVDAILVGRNLHEVVAGRVYRCAQPSGAGLEELVHRYGIRTVINLRGFSPTAPWFVDESRVTHRLNLAQENVCLSAYRLPPVPEIRRLVEILDRAEYPVVLHCRRGSDRTGLASAIVLLLQTDTSLAGAREQLGLRYGHVPLGRPANLDQFFDLYTEWLGQQGLDHSRAAFRRWVVDGYCPAGCRCTVHAVTVPARVCRNEAAAVQVRVRNTGVRAWRLRPETNAGVHAGFIVLDAQDRWVATGRSGLFDALVKPGRSIALTVVVPPLRNLGHYRLLVDMVDEQQCWFFQAGSEPLQRELDVVD